MTGLHPLLNPSCLWIKMWLNISSLAKLEIHVSQVEKKSHEILCPLSGDLSLYVCVQAHAPVPSSFCEASCPFLRDRFIHGQILNISSNMPTVFLVDMKLFTVSIRNYSMLFSSLHFPQWQQRFKSNLCHAPVSVSYGQDFSYYNTALCTCFLISITVLATERWSCVLVSSIWVCNCNCNPGCSCFELCLSSHNLSWNASHTSNDLCLIVPILYLIGLKF